MKEPCYVKIKTLEHSVSRENDIEKLHFYQDTQFTGKANWVVVLLW